MKTLTKIALLILLLAHSAVYASVCETEPFSTPSDNSIETLTSPTANPITLAFDSGARWELCWHVDNASGLVLSNIHYGGPGMPLRKIMESASIAQVIFQYDEDTHASHLISEQGFGGENWVDGAQLCKHGEWVAGTQHRICQQRRELNLLARARHYRSLPRNEITLHAVSKIGLNRFQQVWQLTEDGELNPSLTYSGQVSRFTDNSSFGVKVDDSGLYASNATLLVNWRLDFNIDNSPTNDRVDEFNFIAENPTDLTRKISITEITNESFRKINNTNFRGWRISDQDLSSGDNGESSPTRIGYFLDPQPSGYQFTQNDKRWTDFDIAVTNQKRCEKLASGNQSINQDCGTHLYEFVNDEIIEDPVLWFSLTRHFTPSKEDFPAIRSNRIGFSLIPFDWSKSSPFSDLAIPVNNSAGQSQKVQSQ